MTDVFEFSELKRENLIYDFATLSLQEREEKKNHYAKFEAEKAAEKAAVKAAPVNKPVDNQELPKP
jgi:hypothetical protein